MSECTEQNSSPKYKGVRKRKWGKWVSEIRLPNSRDRIWLGSFDSPEKAARAFDVALYCLRGHGANFNFPDTPPEIPGGRSLTPPEIQVVANRFANNEEVVPPIPPRQQRRVDITARGEIENGGLGPTSLSDQQVANNNFTNNNNSNSNNINRTATTAADWSSSSSFVFETDHHVGGPSSSTAEFGYFPGLDYDEQQYYNLFFPTIQDSNNHSSLSGFYDDVGYDYDDFSHHDSFNLWNFHEDFSGHDEF